MADGGLTPVLLGEPHISGVVSGFGFKEAAVEISQPRILKVVTQQTKAFTRTCFDQTGNEQPVDCPPGSNLRTRSCSFRPYGAGLLPRKRIPRCLRSFSTM